MKIGRSSALLLVLTFCSLCAGQAHNPQKKHLLVLGEEKGYRHDSVSHALATIERLGEKTGLWDTTIRTDTEALTKKRLEFNAKNLNDFDAVLFFTGGELEMDAQQKADTNIRGEHSTLPSSWRIQPFRACSSGHGPSF